MDRTSVLIPRFPPRVTTRRRQPARLLRPIGALLLAGLIVGGATAEIRTSALQSFVFSRVAAEAVYEMGPGPSPAIRFPSQGPYDHRLGYTRLAEFTARLEARGFRVVGQARWSPRLLALAELGVGPLYRDRAQSGLHITDRKGDALHAAGFPERIYEDFSAVPSLVVDTLLFIENRALLDTAAHHHNPAVEWTRLARAAVGQLGVLGGGRPPLGASTLATQIEKYHHSPQGRTDSAGEKLRQMVAASLKAYRGGPDTREARRRIVVDYLNTIPLAAVPGRGEVFGLGDGLERWFGLDPVEVGALLSGSRGSLEERGHAYRHVLALLVSLRRPSDLLLRDRKGLERQVDHFLGALARAGVVGEELAAATRGSRLHFLDAPAPRPTPSFAADKATVAARAALAGALGVDLFELDRLDLAVATTLDGEVQRRVSQRLLALARPEGAVEAGLLGPRLLGRGSDTREIVTSFSLWERTGDANLLRVQVDTLDQPFVVGEGMRLDLGSTAKLRTLVHYLSVVAALHGRYAGLSAEEIAAAPPPADPLTGFVTGALAANPHLELAELLQAALDRRYSASSGERFFTGGGIHRFRNFDGRYEGRQTTLREAFRDSVNLPFVRLMRDVVDHVVAGQVPDANRLLADASDPRRRAYLARYADRVARERLAALHASYRGQDADERLARLVRAIRRPSAVRLAVAFRSVRPEADAQALAAFLAAAPAGARADAARAAELTVRYAPERFSLEDRAYLARVHPLELWLAAHLETHPHASLGDVLAASGTAREEASAWLFRTRHKRAQDRAIRIELERDAFAAIHRDWQAVGYPFASLVPSLATAIGSSGDRPAALSELLGVLLSDGFRLPSRRIEELHFAEGTPYATRLAPASGAVERVLPREVAAAVRPLLFEVVEQGTALRARGAFRAEDGTALPIRVGGKTGTGDNREKQFARGGHLIASHPRSRTATFAFAIDDRFFGVITTHVLGEEAGEHAFTSSLPAQIFRVLAAEIAPLVVPPSLASSVPGARPSAAGRDAASTAPRG